LTGVRRTTPVIADAIDLAAAAVLSTDEAPHERILAIVDRVESASPETAAHREARETAEWIVAMVREAQAKGIQPDAAARALLTAISKAEETPK
jgi:hypothetical protein